MATVEVPHVVLTMTFDEARELVDTLGRASSSYDVYVTLKRAITIKGEES